VFAPDFEVAGTAQEVVFVETVQRNRVGDGEFALRERPGLVEGDGVDLAHRLQMATALDEDAVFGRAGDPRDHRDGRRDHERARTREHEQGDPSDEPRDPRPAEGERRHERRENREGDDDRRVVARKPLDELLAVGLVRLGVLDHLDDSRERGVRRSRGDRDLEVALLVDRSGVDLIARLFVDGNALAGDRGLIDGAFPVGDLAVHRDLLARFDEDGLADRDVVDRHRPFVAVATNHGDLRRELHQLFEGVASPIDRVPLQQLGDVEQEGERRRLDIEGHTGEKQRDARRADDRAGHQEVGIEAQVLRGVVAVRDDHLAADGGPDEHQYVREREFPAGNTQQ
jgi:hypothetical protein